MIVKARRMVFEGLGGWSRYEDRWWSSVGNQGREVDALYGGDAVDGKGFRKVVRSRKRRAS